MMGRPVILTNRKRVIVALVHTVVFWCIALTGLMSTVRPWRASTPASAWVLPAVYLVVTSILTALTAVAGVFLERLYFGCCAVSAGFGLARQVLVDTPLHAAVYVRIAALACAVWIGIVILRTDSPGEPSPAAPETADE